MSVRRDPGRRRWLLPGALAVLSTVAFLARDDARGGGEAGDYAGGEACVACHPAAYDEWAASTHATTLREASAAALPPGVEAGRTVVHEPGRSTFERAPGGGGLVVLTTGPAGEEERYPLTHVVGRRRVHMFLTMVDGARWQVLPGMLEEGTGVWFDYTRLLFGAVGADGHGPPTVEPGDPSFWTGPVRDFSARCSRCHVSGRRLASASPGERPALSWRALGVDCEACHGPGAGHADHHEGFGGEDTLPSLGSLGRDAELGICLTCHLEAEVVDPDFALGEDLFEHVTPTLLDDAERVDPYGRPLELVYDGLPFLSSRCAEKGGLTCTTCHAPHGSPHRSMLTAAPGSSTLCASCHEHIAASVETHAHHPAGAPGGRCTDCHMPLVTIERGHGVVSDHSISIPRLDLPGDRVAEDACTWCHTGGRGAPEGAPAVDGPALRERYAAWWPNARPPARWARLVAEARLAEEGSPALIDALTALARDVEAPRVYRATAARLLGRWPAAASQALLALAASADSLVRREAAGGLAGVRGDAADRMLATALADPSPAVRFAAARAALEGWDRVRARPSLLAALLPVLEADAEAVADDDRRWFRLGAAREIAGDVDGAIDAYRRQVALDPFAHAVRRHLRTLRER